jgi:hypothetical protein
MISELLWNILEGKAEHDLVQSENLLSRQQWKYRNINDKEIVDNTDIINDEQNSNNGVFFGLLK